MHCLIFFLFRNNYLTKQGGYNLDGKILENEDHVIRKETERSPSMTTSRVDGSFLAADNEVVDVSRRESHPCNRHRLGLIVHQLHALLPKTWCGYISICQLLAVPNTAWKNRLAKWSVCLSHSATEDPRCARSQTQLPLTPWPLCLSGFRPAVFHQHMPLLPQARRDDR